MIGPTSQAKSFKRLDGRGKIARRLRTITGEIIEALGGDEAMTPQKRLLITIAAQKAVRAEMIFQRLVTEPNSAETTDRYWIGVVNSLARDLQLLGLEHVEKQPPSLSEYLKAASAEAAA